MDKYNFSEEFFTNENLVKDKRLLQVGQVVWLMDEQLIDPETNTYAIVPAKVVLIESGNIPGRMYYTFVADGSFDDTALNTIWSPETGMNIYRILEDTSPFILEQSDME